MLTNCSHLLSTAWQNAKCLPCRHNSYLHSSDALVHYDHVGMIVVLNKADALEMHELQLNFFAHMHDSAWPYMLNESNTVFLIQCDTQGCWLVPFDQWWHLRGQHKYDINSSYLSSFHLGHLQTGSSDRYTCRTEALLEFVKHCVIGSSYGTNTELLNSMFASIVSVTSRQFQAMLTLRRYNNCSLYNTFLPFELTIYCLNILRYASETTDMLPNPELYTAYGLCTQHHLGHKFFVSTELIQTHDSL